MKFRRTLLNDPDVGECETDVVTTAMFVLYMYMYIVYVP